MSDSAEPLDKLAQAQLLRCLRKSAELGEASEWSRLCEAELSELGPSEYPLPSEIHAEPARTAAVFDVAAVRSLTEK